MGGQISYVNPKLYVKEKSLSFFHPEFLFVIDFMRAKILGRKGGDPRNNDVNCHIGRTQCCVCGVNYLRQLQMTEMTETMQ